MYSLVHTESDITASLLAYSLSADVVNNFLWSPSWTFVEMTSSLCDILMKIYVICYELQRMFPLLVLNLCKVRLTHSKT